MPEAPWLSTPSEVIMVCPSHGCSIGRTWTKAIVCGDPCITRMSLPWLVGARRFIAKPQQLFVAMVTLETFKMCVRSPPRHPLPVDVLAQLQLGHHRPRRRAASSSHQHLPGLGRHGAHHCGHLQSLPEAWKIRHGTSQGPTANYKVFFFKVQCVKLGLIYDFKCMIIRWSLIVQNSINKTARKLLVSCILCLHFFVKTVLLIGNVLSDRLT